VPSMLPSPPCCARRKHAAFKGSRVVVRSAEGDAPVAPEPAPEAAPEAVVAEAAPEAAIRTRAPKREVTVQLDAVKAGDEFEGSIVSEGAHACSGASTIMR
jgi:hypothetical protein